MIPIRKELYERVKEITSTKYLDYTPSVEEKSYCLNFQEYENIIEDLILEIDRLNERISDIEEDRNSNYRPISVEEQIGYNENW